MSETIKSLNGILFFQTVARLRSFRKAAEALSTSPATVSRRISELEAQINAQLLVRTTRSIHLTPVGEKLLQDAKMPMRQLLQATKQAINARDELAGLVRIATTYTICETHILPALPALYQSHPDIRVELILNESVIDIRDQNIDFALRAGNIKDETLIARKICTDTLAYFSAVGASPQPFIEYAEAPHQTPNPQILVHDMRAIHTLIRQGFGEGWLPISLCAKDEKSGLLRRHPDRETLDFDFHIVFHANRFVPRRTRVVMDALAEYAASLDL